MNTNLYQYCFELMIRQKNSLKLTFMLHKLSSLFLRYLCKQRHLVTDLKKKGGDTFFSSLSFARQVISLEGFYPYILAKHS